MHHIYNIMHHQSPACSLPLFLICKKAESLFILLVLPKSAFVIVCVKTQSHLTNITHLDAIFNMILQHPAPQMKDVGVLLHSNLQTLPFNVEGLWLGLKVGLGLGYTLGLKLGFEAGIHTGSEAGNRTIFGFSG